VDAVAAPQRRELEPASVPIPEGDPTDRPDTVAPV
jgi:hypothetical protein